MSRLPIMTGVDELHAHARHTGHRWVDLVLAISAIVISVISLFVAMEHGRTERQLVAASTWPFLEFDASHQGSVDREEITYSIKNGGLGPAHIISSKVFLGGVQVRNLSELLVACCAFQGDLAQEQSAGLSGDSAIEGIIDPREKQTLVSWQRPSAPKGFWPKFDALRTRLSFDVCYCSALGDCWRTDLKETTQPTHVARCDPRDGRFDDGQ